MQRRGPSHGFGGAALVASLPLLAGCAGLEARNALEELHEHYDRGELEAAERGLTARLGEPGAEALASRPLYLLQRGYLRQRRGDHLGSSADFRLADEQLELRDFTDATLEKVASNTINANFEVFRGDPHEKILLNTLEILNQFQLGDRTRLKVAARRAGVMDDYQTELERDFSFENALTPLLYGLAFEVAGETQQAHVAYKTAYEVSGAPFLRPRLQRIAREHGFSDAARWEREFGALEDPVPAGHGTVVTVVMNGQTPVRDEVLVPIPVGLRTMKFGAVTVAQMDIQRIVIPALKRRSHRFRSGAVRIDAGPAVPLVQVVDVEGQALAQFEKDRFGLIRESVLRALIRFQMDEQARRESKQDVAQFIDLFTDVLEVFDVADLRCWSLLPAEILVDVQSAPAGDRALTVTMGAVGGEVVRRQVRVEAGEVALVIVHADA